jgi:PAS domain S-box-containing protein
MHYDLPQLLARLRGLFEVAALPRAPEDRADALAAVAEAIANALEWGTVAINLVRPAWDDFEVVAVYGPKEATDALLGTTSNSLEWEPLLVERFYRRGAYLVRSGEYDWGQLSNTYVPPRFEPVSADAWLAEDGLFVPMRDSQGRLIGILSVDDPASGKRPDDEQLDALVAVAAYAARAVESANAAAETIRHRRALELLLSVSSDLTRMRSIDEMLHSICDAVHEALGFEHVVVELADRERDRYVPLAAVGTTLDREELELDTDIAGLDAVFDGQFEVEGCYLLSREQALAHVGVEPTSFRSSRNGTSAQAWDRHWLVVPLVDLSGERLGFIWVDDPEDCLLPSRPKLQALRMFANQAAMTLESARQVATLERRTEELEALHATTLGLIERPSSGTLLESIVSRACTLLGTGNAFLFLRDPATDMLELAVSLGIFGAYRGTQIARGEGISGRVWDENRPLVVDDYSSWDDRADAYGAAEFRATAAFPLRIGDDVVGVLGVGYSEPDRRFTPSAQELLGRFAQLASLALANARLYNALRDERDHSQRLIESANAMVVGVDDEGRVEVFNHEAERVTGYRADEVLGKNWYELVVPRQRYPEAWAVFARAIASGELPDVFEGAIVTKSGEERLISWRNSALTVNGDLRGSLSFGIDVTEVRRLEEELRQSQKMEAVGRLAGGIAHDFNNLLTAITGYGELALGELGDSAVRGHVYEMKRAGERAAALTKQLLAFSRRQVLQPEVVDPNAIVADFESMLRRLLGEQVELCVHLDPRVGTTKADPGQLQQVVMNLALNARDAMPKGGRLRISTATARVDGVDYVELAVADNGTGMDQDTLEQAFEPFFTTKPPGEGTGLGLSTVYGIVKQTGGDLVATSEPGRGTTMRVLLPLVGVEPAPRPESASTAAHAPWAATVLLVEDEEVVRRLVTAMLEAAGYRVLAAESSEAALAIAEDEDRIEVLVTDVVMPGLSGPELAAQLLQKQPELRVLFVSGYTAEAIAKHGQISPGTLFLEKPFTRAELTRALQKLTIEPLVA